MKVKADRDESSPYAVMLAAQDVAQRCKVKCGVRGSLESSCHAIGLIDRLILGEHHLYQRPVYRRKKECSVNSLDYGPPPPDPPGWCLAPFDPEGFISSLMAAISCFLGLHFGHVIVHFEGSMQRIVFWSMSSFSLLISGYTMKILGMPLCKPLYTLSYTCITAGALGLLLTIIYYMEVATKLEVKAIPTFLLMKDSVVVDKLVGANPEEMKKRIDDFVQSVHVVYVA